jgi:alpha-tubulin suppressor-like RCC1 family protein
VLLDTATGNRLKCFGANNNGQLGLGDIIDRHTDTYMTSDEYVDVGAAGIVSMHLGSFHTCVMLDTTEVKCFGLNQNGQLGLGDRKSRGRFNHEMGSYLPAVDFGTDRYAVRVFNSAGVTMCALLNSAELKCWGGNQGYALGTSIAESDNIGDTANEMGDHLVAIKLPTGKNVVNVWVSTHVVVLFDDHTMTMWGSFATDTLGITNNAGNNDLPIIYPGTGRNPVQVMLNRFSTIVLFDNGDVVPLGINRELSLGRCTGSIIDANYHAGLHTRDTGEYEIVDDTKLIYFDERSPSLKVKGLASNSFTHFCVVTSENEVMCWGINDHGQLGMGHSDPPIM